MNYEIFTDGSTFNNGNKKKIKYGGLGVYFPNDEVENISMNVENATNNICELKACIVGINALVNSPSFHDNDGNHGNHDNHDNHDKIIVYSDSEYVIKSITSWIKGWEKNGWKTKSKKPVKNKELMIELNELYKTYNIEFIHVRSHQLQPSDKNSKEYKLWYGNYNADKLATQGSVSVFK